MSVNLDRPIRVKGGNPARYVTKYINFQGVTMYVVINEVGGTYAGDRMEACGYYTMESLEKLFENDPVVSHSFRNVYVCRTSGIHSFGAPCDSIEDANTLYNHTKSVASERAGLFKTTYHDGVAAKREFLP